MSRHSATIRNNIESLARSEMHRCGLDSTRWVFAWNRRRTSLGLCRYVRTTGTGTIELSQFIGNLDGNQILDTIRHEIAHALDFDRRGDSAHDAVWRAICVEVGAKPQRLADATAIEMSTPKWTATCRCGCGQSWSYYRRPNFWRSYSRHGEPLTWEANR